MVRARLRRLVVGFFLVAEPSQHQRVEIAYPSVIDELDRGVGALEALDPDGLRGPVDAPGDRHALGRATSPQQSIGARRAGICHGNFES